MRKCCIFIIILLFTGVVSGWLYGTCIVNNMMKGKIGISTFLFLPSKNILDTYIMLNSGEELKRLEGYYAYRETGLRDSEFLLKRYNSEKSDLIKKTIIWILESGIGDEEMQGIYKKLYDASPDSLKKYLQKKINSYDMIENDTR